MDHPLFTPEMRALLRKRQNELVAAASAAVRPSVVSIYGSKENGRPVHIGSAVRLIVDGMEILLTAAHVIDENQHTSLYVEGRNRLELLQAEFFLSPAPSGRCKDDLDFAFCRIPDALLPLIGGTGLPEGRIDVSPPSGRGCLHVAVGYPNSRNRRYNPVKRTVRPTAFIYSEVHVPDPAIAKDLPNGGYHHIMMPYAKRSRDESGRVVSSTAMRGMSGGAVVDAGRLGTLVVLGGLVRPEPKLVAMFIALRKGKTMLSMRMDVILPEIRKAFP